MVGWAQRSVPTIPGKIAGKWRARFALPTLRIGPSGNPYICTDIRQNPKTERGLSDTAFTQEARTDCPFSPAPFAFLHHARHHGDGRLRMAERRQMAGGAARPLDPGSGYTKISGSRERLHRKPA